MSKLTKLHFWKWFERYNQEYANLLNKSQKEEAYWHNEMKAHLRAYFKFLNYSIVYNFDGGAPILNITVGGKAKYFHHVDAFVEIAPNIPGWKINALEEPVPMYVSQEKLIEQTGIDPYDFYFTYDDNGPLPIPLNIYHPLITKENEDLALELAMNAVYNLIGERAYGTDISCIRVANLSTIKGKYIRTLEELTEWVGNGLSGIMIDINGKIERRY